MSKHSTGKERREALLRAREQGLNIRTIAYAVVKPLISIIEVCILLRKHARS